MIWLLRHGDAEDGTDDSARELTGKGRKQAKTAGLALKKLGTTIDACLTSPKVRARQTAELACEALGIKPEDDTRLIGGGFDPLELAAGRGDVLLVGHEPDFSSAVAAVTGAHIKFRKGGLAAVDERVMHTLLRPADIRAIANA